MDSAYDAKPIMDFIIGKGKIPIIDPNKSRVGMRRTATTVRRS
jgi:hypothetical protein